MGKLMTHSSVMSFPMGENAREAPAKSLAAVVAAE